MSLRDCRRSFLQRFLYQLLCLTLIRISGLMQHTWRTCTSPSVCAELMLNACCVSSVIFISLKSRSSHLISGNCFNMQFNWPKRQVDFTFLSCLGMLKQLSDIWQCWKSNRDCLSFLKYSCSPTAPVADCSIYLCCVLRTHSRSFWNSNPSLADFKSLRVPFQGVQAALGHKKQCHEFFRNLFTVVYKCPHMETQLLGTGVYSVHSIDLIIWLEQCLKTFRSFQFH